MVSKSRLVKALVILVLSLTVCTLLLAQFESALDSSGDASPGSLMAERTPASPVPVDASWWKYIVLHHSGTMGGNAGRFAEDHRERFGAQTVGYHFVIGNGDGSGDGYVEACPRWLRQQAGAHAQVDGHPEYNQQGIGICLVGDFRRNRPTELQMKQLALVVEGLQTRYGIADENVVMHGDLEQTDCPGRFLREAWARRSGAGR
jgi:N-acetyl-anhydromuramyl-L-alanine amidase AmpD